MTLDQSHTLIACVALGLIAVGAWLAFGPGYAALALGLLLLSGVIYARVR